MDQFDLVKHHPDEPEFHEILDQDGDTDGDQRTLSVFQRLGKLDHQCKTDEVADIDDQGRDFTQSHVAHELSGIQDLDTQ